MEKSISRVLRGIILPPIFSSLEEVFPEFVLAKQKKGKPFLSGILKFVNQTKP